MNPADPRTVFERLLEDSAPDGIDVEAAVLRGGKMRRRRRGLMTGSAVLGIGVASGIALLVARHPGIDTNVPTGPARAATSLAVKCTPEGIVVSGDTLVATAQGAVFEVSSTMPDGAYLNFAESNWGSGDPLPHTEDRWTLPIPPGDITLSCTLNDDPRDSAVAHVVLADPGHYWRDTTLADFGCHGAIPSWVYGPGLGDSARGAVDDLLAQFSTPQRTYTANPVDIGYIDAPTQTWLASTDGRIYMSVLVTRAGDGYTADPDTLC
jgi:hypothetical protein